MTKIGFAEQGAVITGAASGIGAALARRAAKSGMRLILADVDRDGLDRTASECGSAVETCLKVDVGNPEDVEELARQSFARLKTVDLLCNNAGVVPGGRHRPIWEYEVEDWRWAFEVNVLGIVNGLRSFVPRMLENGSPAHILNTTSVSGFISGGGSPVYGASKHAAVRATEALYASLRERASRIGVSMLVPGLVNTRIFETERVRPERLRTRAGEVEEAEELRSVASQGANPDEVAQAAFSGINADIFYIFTSEKFDEYISRRASEIVLRSNPVFENFNTVARADASELD